MGDNGLGLTYHGWLTDSLTWWMILIIVVGILVIVLIIVLIILLCLLLKKRLVSWSLRLRLFLYICLSVCLSVCLYVVLDYVQPLRNIFLECLVVDLIQKSIDIFLNELGPSSRSHVVKSSKFELIHSK